MKHFEYFETKYDSEIIEICLANPMYFDVRQFEELRDEMADFVNTFEPKRLIVNFRHVRFCSTAVISALMVLKDRVEKFGGQVKFCEMNEAVRESFANLRLDGPVFEIHSTAAGALAGFGR